MLKKITYTNHIKCIGVEFEGFYSNNAVDQIKISSNAHPYFSGYTSDMSVHGMASDKWAYGYNTYELRTRALNEKNLNGMFAFMNRLFKKNDYRINDSCGLHYHISFTDFTFANVCNPDFFQAYTQMVRENFPAIWEKRATNRYSTTDLFVKSRGNNGYTKRTLKNHFKRQSQDRYRAINYSYKKHGTIEFRFFGSSYATIESLADCIGKTITLIEQFTEKKAPQIHRRIQQNIKDTADTIELTSESQLEKNITIDIDIDGLDSVHVLKPSERLLMYWYKYGGKPAYIDFLTFQADYAQKMNLENQIKWLSENPNELKRLGGNNTSPNQLKSGGEELTNTNF